MTYSQLTGDYQFTATFSNFVPISNGVDLDTIESSYEVSYSIPIGFSFNYESMPYSYLKAASHGLIMFDTSKTTAFAVDLSHGTHRPSLSPIMGPLRGSEPGCQASYKTTGSSPNRVFTIEWLNWQWGGGQQDSTLSFQILLFETSNIIEFRYRRELHYQNTSFAFIGISGHDIGSGNFLSVDSVLSNPSVSSSLEYINQRVPPSNRVYRFTPPSCPSPTDQFYTDATYQSIDVTWKGWPGFANRFSVQYDTSGFNLGSGSIVASIQSQKLLIQGLQSNKRYDFYVRDSCGIGNSSKWRGPYGINTAKSVPFTETFESLLSNKKGNQANGWICRDTEGYLWWSDKFTSSTNGTGPNADHTTLSAGGIYMVIQSANGNSGDTSILYSPFYHLDSIDNAYLIYWSHRFGLGFSTGYVDILVNGNWINIDSIQGATQTYSADPYEKRVIDLNNFLGNYVRLRFRSVRSTNQGDWAIDDVSIVDNSMNLLEPLNDTTIEIIGAFKSTVKFRWNSQYTLTGPDYRFVLAGNRSMNNPFVLSLSANNGNDTVARIRFEFLDSIMLSNGLSNGDTMDFYWTVFAESGVDTVFSIDTFKLKLIKGNVMGEFNLVSPTIFTNLDVKGNRYQTNPFHWTASSEEIIYIWEIIDDNSPSIYLKTIVDTNISNITNFSLDSLLGLSAVILGNKRLFQWNVYAALGGDTIKSKNGPYPIYLWRQPVTADFNLILPSNDTIFTYYNQIVTDLNYFKWEEAQINGDGNVKYYFLIDEVSGDFSSPLLNVLADFSGYQEKASVQDQVLINTFHAAGKKDGEMFNGKWTVVTEFGDTALNHLQFRVMKDLYFGINENTNKLASIRPNPTNGELWVSFKEEHSGIIEVKDLMGRMVYSQMFQNEKLVRMHLQEPSGVYILSVHSPFGISYQRIVIE